jgi:hypothetical protein
MKEMIVMQVTAKLLSNTQFHKGPLWITYNPEQHKVNAKQVRRILKALEPGDIFLSKHDGYPSNLLIPGFYNHIGIYIGSDQIIHSIGEGVTRYDILKFLRCDSVVQLRLVPDSLPNCTEDEAAELKMNACNIAEKLYEERCAYDYDFIKGNNSYYCSEFVNQCYQGMWDDLYEFPSLKWLPDFVVRKILKERLITPQDIYDKGGLTIINEFKN